MLQCILKLKRWSPGAQHPAGVLAPSLAGLRAHITLFPSEKLCAQREGLYRPIVQHLLAESTDRQHRLGVHTGGEVFGPYCAAA